MIFRAGRIRLVSARLPLFNRTYSGVRAPIQEGDRVVIRDAKSQIFTKPLKADREAVTHWGSFKHVDIIGKQSRDVVKSHTGSEARVFRPTLEEYVLLTPRLVTPIYPADAAVIVSLLDINATAPATDVEDHDSKLEILEAGTGHGALTLYLARAVHTINPPRLPVLDGENVTERDEDWRHSRKAIVHTIDNRPAHSQHAEQIAKGFRRGVYANNIDFNVGDVGEWIDQQIVSRGLGAGQSFLDHIILDLPDTHRYVEKAASVLHTDGSLLVFCPNVTQIVKIVELIRTTWLPLEPNRFLELGPGLSRGREWDVRAVQPRARARAGETARKNAEQDSSSGSDIGLPSQNTSEVDSQSTTGGNSGVEHICRPRVGIFQVGGFLGVWKKMKR